MKFFVSGKIGDEAETIKAMRALKKAGHVITFDWTKIRHLRPFEKHRLDSREAAVKECRGVLDADVLIIFAHEKGVGMYVELGIAIGAGIPIRIVTAEQSRTMFIFHPLVKTVDSFGKILEEFC